MDKTKLVKAQAIKEYSRCKADDKYFIYNYCYCFDSRKQENKIFLMKPWPHLLNLIDELNKFQKLIIEKSRDMGISWTIMAWQLHKALFKEGWMSLNISRREWEVEDTGKTPRSLFGRLDFMYKRLPSYLKLRADNPFLTFKVQSNNSYISGESANVHAGRDTQYSFIFVDEAGAIPILADMWKALANSSNAVCLNSTPPTEGKSHKFSQMRFAKDSNFKVLTYHWSEHPEKDAVWYANKTKDMTDEDIARELDINYDKSISMKIYHEWDDNIHIAKAPILFNPNKPLFLSFDFGLDDPESVLFYQKDLDADKNVRLLLIDEYETGNLLTHEHFINIEKKLVLMGYRDTLGKLTCYGDPAGTRRERTSGRSVVKEYEGYGLKITVKEASLDDRRRAVKLLLKARDSMGQPRFLVSPKCVNFIESIKNHQRKRHDEDTAKKDKTCHSVTSHEFYCVNEFPPVIASAVIYGKDPEDRKRRPLQLNMNRRRSIIWV